MSPKAFRSVGIAVGMAAVGCSLVWQISVTAAPKEHQHDKAASVKSSSPELHRYVRAPEDPEWLARVGTFHGHLGPWVVLGAMIGRDAVERLNTRGYWDVEVIVWMVPKQQRQPWSCILDGLQVSTGATLGKQNIGFSHSPQVVRDGRPVVYVRRFATDSSPAAGLSYRVNDALATTLKDITPERLEAMSRELAHRRVADLFEIQQLSSVELDQRAIPKGKD